MSTVTIGVASLGGTQRRLSAAYRGKKQGARISFASEDLLWKTLTPKRWALLKHGRPDGERTRCGGPDRPADLRGPAVKARHKTVAFGKLCLTPQ